MSFLRWSLAVALLASGGSVAQPVYRWVDADGGVTYTNDPSAIPAQHRPRAKVVSGGQLSVLSVKEAPAAARPGSEAPAPAPVPAIDPGQQQRDDELAQLAVECQWRDRFRDARRRIEQIEESIKADKKRLDDPGGNGMMVIDQATGRYLPTSEYEVVKDRVRRSELELKNAKQDLDDLDREASRHSIPREWRR